MPDEKQGNDQSVKSELPVGSSPLSAEPASEKSAAAAPPKETVQVAKAEAAATAPPPATASADAAKELSAVSSQLAAKATQATAQGASEGGDQSATPDKAAAVAEKSTAPAAPKAAAPPVAAKPPVAGAAAAGAPAAAKPAAPPKPEGPKPVLWDSPLVQKLKGHYGTGLKEASSYVGQNYVLVYKTIAHEVLSLLRYEGFDYCVDITAVHYPKKDEQFELIYILYSFPKNERMRVKTSIKEGEKIPTVSDIWPTANWLEREVFDMFGIEFEGHPDPRRILLPEDWKGHPLRKDHDILKQDTEWVHIHLGIESGQ